MRTDAPAILPPPPTTLAPSAAAAFTLPPAGAAGALDPRRSFAAVLGRAEASAGAAEQTPEERAREAAENLVSISLVQPLLEQLRSTGEAAPPFAPTRGERQFRALLDAELAQRMTRAARFPMVDRLARDLLERAAGATAAPPES